MDAEPRGAVDEMLKGVDARLTKQTSEIDEKFSKFESSIKNDLKLHFERMEDLVKRAAEGYGATLDSIDRRLDRLEQKVDNGFRDHAHLLTNHEQRITALEQKP